MAYDWVYPPGEGGTALIHVDWGNDYTLKKPYWLFRQWAEPLVPGMRVVDAVASGTGAAGVKPTAFLSADGRKLVVHIVNIQDSEAPVEITLPGGLATAASATRRRTSASEDDVELPPLSRTAAGFADTLPARSLVTYRFAR
jgi:hypothetical protein